MFGNESSNNDELVFDHRLGKGDYEYYVKQKYMNRSNMKYVGSVHEIYLLVLHLNHGLSLDVIRLIDAPAPPS